MRFTYQSMVTPSSVYDYDMKTRERTLLKQQEVPRRLRSGAVRGASASGPTARDGTKVPISLVYRKGLALDGKAPLLLYAYGSYGVVAERRRSRRTASACSIAASSTRMAHIRGGGELGEEWREQGRMMKKMNTFTDFIDCAEYLVQEPLHVARPAGHPGRQRRRPARWARWRTCGRTSSRPSSRRCRSST